MIITKASPEHAAAIAPLIMSAMADILHTFIGMKNDEKAIQMLTTLIAVKGNQYSYEHCWIVQEGAHIIGAAIVYDGAELDHLRHPVKVYIEETFGVHFEPEDETGPGEFYIDSVGVSPSHQGTGIGSALFRFLIDEYVHRRRKTLGLLVDKENVRARNLYLSLGFEVVGEQYLAGRYLEHMQHPAPSL